MSDLGDVVPVAPTVAGDTFGPRLPLALAYAELLATEASVRGLIGPREVPRLWDRHLLNCAVIGELIDPEADVIDVGSGAGLPGIPLAIARPDLTVVLVEPLQRRAGWLGDVIDRLGLTGVSVRRARAEALHGELTARVVTARAVAPMSRLAGWCLPLVRPGGSLVAMKGQSADQELAEARDTINGLGGADAQVRVVGASRLSDPTTVVQVRVGTTQSAGRPIRVAGRRSEATEPTEKRRGER
jgi:16S rRNA (guanine527-N7)-methyltransferase